HWRSNGSIRRTGRRYPKIQLLPDRPPGRSAHRSPAMRCYTWWIPRDISEGVDQDAHNRPKENKFVVRRKTVNRGGRWLPATTAKRAKSPLPRWGRGRPTCARALNLLAL